MKKKDLRNIPSVSALLEMPEISEFYASYPRALVVSTIREVLDDLRGSIGRSDGSDTDLSPPSLLPRVRERLLAKGKVPISRVINATGVLVHTGLGRTPLATEAIKDIKEAAGGYCSLEVDISTGKRSSRVAHIEALVVALTGAEAAMVVNNNAAAVLLGLDTLAVGKEVTISRSQQVEIGGSFRMPEVMAKSGAKMVEVGTTNRTYISDYRGAITLDTALLLNVHSSNYRIVGFTAEAKIEELVQLGREFEIPVMYDLGSGALFDLKQYGLPHEPTVEESVRAGVDITTFSTDKLLGGPQGGVIVGKKRFVDLMKQNPLARALRVDKLTIAALEATLKLYADKEAVAQRLPVLKMLTRTLEDIERESKQFIKELSSRSGGKIAATLEDGSSAVGGGSLPGEAIPTKLIAISAKKPSAQELSDRLRQNVPPIFARIEDDRLLLDLRTVTNGSETAETLNAILSIFGVA
ncbi:MAG: L-seryl-tRNA(Sec) selenium transferase [Planctomycetes bacterium]|nr:L-seryl-tRNA(Sec) selenium transferase [Planctomycetota bacterium]